MRKLFLLLCFLGLGWTSGYAQSLMTYKDASGRTARVSLNPSGVLVEQGGVTQPFLCNGMGPYGYQYVNNYVGSVVISPDLKTMLVYTRNYKYRFHLLNISAPSGGAPGGNFSTSGNPFQAPDTSSFGNVGTTSAPSGSVGHMVRETCSFCHGTKISPIATSVAAFGNIDEHWCPVCQKMVSASHGAHLSCPSCQGKGYIEKFRAY